MNTYRDLGAVLAEAMGLISEKRRVHKVGEIRRNQPFGRTPSGEMQVPGQAGGEGGKGGRPQHIYNQRTGAVTEVPGKHSTGGEERGVTKGEKREAGHKQREAAAKAKEDAAKARRKAEADANNAAYRKGSRMK